MYTNYCIFTTKTKMLKTISSSIEQLQQNAVPYCHKTVHFALDSNMYSPVPLLFQKKKPKRGQLCRVYRVNKILLSTPRSQTTKWRHDAIIK